MECLLENGAEINCQRKFWKFHHLQLDRNEPDKAPESVLSGAVMIWEADRLGSLKSSFSVCYSRKPIDFITNPWSTKALSEPGLLGREEGRANMSLDTNIFQEHNPDMHHAPFFSHPHGPITKHRKEPSGIYCLKKLSVWQVTAWPCPAFKSERQQGSQNIPCGPQASPVPPPSH